MNVQYGLSPVKVQSTGCCWDFSLADALKGITQAPWPPHLSCFAQLMIESSSSDDALNFDVMLIFFGYGPESRREACLLEMLLICSATSDRTSAVHFSLAYAEQLLCG